MTWSGVLHGCFLTVMLFYLSVNGDNRMQKTLSTKFPVYSKRSNITIGDIKSYFKREDMPNWKQALVEKYLHKYGWYKLVELWRKHGFDKSNNLEAIKQAIAILGSKRGIYNASSSLSSRGNESIKATGQSKNISVPGHKRYFIGSILPKKLINHTAVSVGESLTSHFDAPVFRELQVGYKPTNINNLRNTSGTSGILSFTTERNVSDSSDLIQSGKSTGNYTTEIVDPGETENEIDVYDNEDTEDSREGKDSVDTGDRIRTKAESPVSVSKNISTLRSTLSQITSTESAHGTKVSLQDEKQIGSQSGALGGRLLLSKFIGKGNIERNRSADVHIVHDDDADENSEAASQGGIKPGEGSNLERLSTLSATPATANDGKGQLIDISPVSDEVESEDVLLTYDKLEDRKLSKHNASMITSSLPRQGSPRGAILNSSSVTSESVNVSSLEPANANRSEVDISHNESTGFASKMNIFTDLRVPQMGQGIMGTGNGSQPLNNSKQQQNISPQKQAQFGTGVFGNRNLGVTHIDNEFAVNGSVNVSQSDLAPTEFRSQLTPTHENASSHLDKDVEPFQTPVSYETSHGTDNGVNVEKSIGAGTIGRYTQANNTSVEAFNSKISNTSNETIASQSRTVDHSDLSQFLSKAKEEYAKGNEGTIYSQHIFPLLGNALGQPGQTYRTDGPFPMQMAVQHPKIQGNNMTIGTIDSAKMPYLVNVNERPEVTPESPQMPFAEPSNTPHAPDWLNDSDTTNQGLPVQVVNVGPPQPTEPQNHDAASLNLPVMYINENAKEWNMTNPQQPSQNMSQTKNNVPDNDNATQLTNQSGIYSNHSIVILPKTNFSSDFGKPLPVTFHDIMNITNISLVPLKIPTQGNTSRRGSPGFITDLYNIGYIGFNKSLDGFKDPAKGIDQLKNLAKEKGIYNPEIKDDDDDEKNGGAASSKAGSHGFSSAESAAEASSEAGSSAEGGSKSKGNTSKGSKGGSSSSSSSSSGSESSTEVEVSIGTSTESSSGSQTSVSTGTDTGNNNASNGPPKGDENANNAGNKKPDNATEAGSGSGSKSGSSSGSSSSSGSTSETQVETSIGSDTSTNSSTQVNSQANTKSLLNSLEQRVENKSEVATDEVANKTHNNDTVRTFSVGTGLLSSSDGKYMPVAVAAPFVRNGDGDNITAVNITSRRTSGLLQNSSVFDMFPLGKAIHYPQPVAKQTNLTTNVVESTDSNKTVRSDASFDSLNPSNPNTTEGLSRDTSDDTKNTTDKAKDKKKPFWPVEDYEPECSKDKPCPEDQYCREHFCYNCHPLRIACERPDQCCPGLQCIYGRCDIDSKGSMGSFCENDTDCVGDGCCVLEPTIHNTLSICKPKLAEFHQCSPVLFRKVWYGNSRPSCGPCKEGLECVQRGVYGNHKVCMKLQR